MACVKCGFQFFLLTTVGDISRDFHHGNWHIEGDSKWSAVPTLDVPITIFRLLLSEVFTLQSLGDIFRPPGSVIPMITINTLAKMKAAGEKFACVTAYDYCSAHAAGAAAAPCSWLTCRS